jgi:hypothetical protein
MKQLLNYPMDFRVPICEMFAPKQVCLFHIVFQSRQFIIFNLDLLGMCAIRAEREYVVEEDFMKAVRKVGDTKKLETKLDYKPL